MNPNTLTYEDFTANGITKELEERVVHTLVARNTNNQILNAEVWCYNGVIVLKSMFIEGHCHYGVGCKNRDICPMTMHDCGFHPLTPEEPFCTRPGCKLQHPVIVTNYEKDLIPNCDLVQFAEEPLFCKNFIKCPKADCPYLHLRPYTNPVCKFGTNCTKLAQGKCFYEHVSEEVIKSPYPHYNIQPCKFFWNQLGCRNANCKIPHVPVKVSYDENEIPIPRSKYMTPKQIEDNLRFVKQKKLAPKGPKGPNNPVVPVPVYNKPRFVKPANGVHNDGTPIVANPVCKNKVVYSNKNKKPFVPETRNPVCVNPINKVYSNKNKTFVPKLTNSVSKNSVCKKTDDLPKKPYGSKKLLKKSVVKAANSKEISLVESSLAETSLVEPSLAEFPLLKENPITKDDSPIRETLVTKDLSLCEEIPLDELSQLLFQEEVAAGLVGVTDWSLM